jgi:hypothetical protein
VLRADQGLKELPRSDRPNALIVFFTFRIMVGLGLAMIALAPWRLWQRRRATQCGSRIFLRTLLAMGPSGLMAILAGWYDIDWPPTMGCLQLNVIIDGLDLGVGMLYSNSGSRPTTQNGISGTTRLSAVCWLRHFFSAWRWAPT